MQSTTAHLKGFFAGLGFLGFFLAWTELLTSDHGFYLAHSLLRGFLFAAALALTGGVVTFASWCLSYGLVTLTIAVCLLLVSLTAGDRMMNGIPLDYQTRALAETLFILVGLIGSVVLARFTFLFLVQPLDGEMSKQALPPKKRVSFKGNLRSQTPALLLSFGAIFPATVTLPAFRNIVPLEVVFFGIILLLAIFIFRSWPLASLGFVIGGFFLGRIGLHLFSILLGGDHPVSMFLNIGPPVLVTSLILCGAIGGKAFRCFRGNTLGEKITRTVK